MPFLRLAFVFAFFAFSIARAECDDEDDFEIFATFENKKESLSCNAVVSKNVMWTDKKPLELSVDPPTGDIVWRLLGNDIPIFNGFVYPVPINDNQAETRSFTVEKDGDIRKTITINIQVRPSYTVSFVDTDGITELHHQDVMKDKLATKPTPDPTKTGYNFDVWLLNGSGYDFNTPVTASIKLTAKWNAKKYTVKFDPNGGNPKPPDTTVDYNSKINPPATPPTRTGYYFDDWYFNNTPFDFNNTTITGPITLTAKWNAETYTVTFKSDGSFVEDKTVNYSSTVSPPTPAPTKADYNLDGWLLNGSKYNFSTPVTGNITLNANWKPQPYVITYIDEYTCANCPRNYTINDLPITVSEPTRIGYNFINWFEDPNYLVVATNPIVSPGNKTFYAKWGAPITYNITYDTRGGTIIPVSPPPPNTYNVTQSITLPTLADRCGYRFDGWFDNSTFSGTAMAMGATIPAGSIIGDQTFHAKWTIAPDTLTKNKLSPSFPPNKDYDGSQIVPVTVSSECPSIIDILYDNGTDPPNNNPPKNADTYQVYASISQNGNYIAGKILLGEITINKASLIYNVSANVKSREYDATTKATLDGDPAFTLTSGTLDGTNLTASDYSISTEFDNPNAGKNKTINLSVTQSNNGPLFKNYKIDFQTITPITAEITKAKATNMVLKIKADDYELSDPNVPKVAIVDISLYIDQKKVRYEYKLKDSTNYSPIQPNRVGNWSVRAIVDSTNNYEEKIDTANFVVTRGSATTVIHNIAFDTTGFYLDSALSGKLRRYYVAGTSLCKIKSTRIYITIKEPDIYLKYRDTRLESHPEADGLHYKIDTTFGKPGLDTLFYELFSTDGIYSESDTILIETPIPFEHPIIGQKWNNVLFVNNNPQANGDYKFTDFKWFKNNDEISALQFYSAGPSSTDTLNPDDIYKVVMQTAEGIRISTCEGKAIEVPAQAQKRRIKTTKQVLGIKEKSLNSSSKVYNLNGKLTKETPAGVYIVEE